MRIIDADKFLAYLIYSKHIDSLTCGEVKEAIKMCEVDVLDEQDPSEGHWITTPRETQPFDWIDFGDEKKTYHITCSKCDYQLTSTSKMTNFRFCPKCGKRMAESEEA